LFGTTLQGGAEGDGTVFEIPHGSTAATTVASFDGSNGQYPGSGVTLDSSGDLFGTTENGGAGGNGTVFEIAHGVASITTVASFNGNNGENPFACITLDAAGDLFGTTARGGMSGRGTVYEIAQGSTTVATLMSFGSNSGGGAFSGVTFDTSGDLFGTTFDDGTNQDGTIFEIPAGATTATTVANFSSSTGGLPSGTLTFDSNGNLFGATSSGGAGGYGDVYELPQGSTTVTALASFSSNSNMLLIGANGITVDPSGNLFGATYRGGANLDGAVFELAHGSHTLTTLASFNGTNGLTPKSSVILDPNGNLFGTTELGGSGAGGTVFELPHLGTAITTLASFVATSGIDPQDGVTLDASGDLFGATVNGGANSDGTVYEIARGSDVITTIASFNGTNGQEPTAVTLDASGDLFGTCTAGGGADLGTVFEIAVGSSAITTLAGFANNSVYNGEAPEAGVTLDQSGDLFGTTPGVGSLSGTVFEIAQGTSTITTLVTLSATNQKNPLAGVTLDPNGDVFGTTAGNVTGVAGNPGGDGTVFEIAHGSNVLTTLAVFNGNNGWNPSGVTLDAAGDLFGTTNLGGTTNQGTVFEIARGSATITTLVTFDGSNGAYPYGAGLTLDSAGDLFGTTGEGGVENAATVFEIPYGSTTLTALASLNAYSGGQPESGVIIDPGGDLFGTTGFGGPDQYGAIFELTPASATILSSPQVSATYGAPTTLTATLRSGFTALPGETISFALAGGTLLGTAVTDANGLATLTLSQSLAAGDYSFTASFAGDANYDTSQSPAQSLDISQAATSTAISSSANPAAVGQTVTFTATVSNGTPFVPPGTVTFMDGTTVLGSGTLNGSGVATGSYPFVSGGNHTITAIYGGDSNFVTSGSSAIVQVVTPPSSPFSPTSISVPAVDTAYGAATTFTATLTSGSTDVAGEPVAFTLAGGTPLGTAITNLNGVAILTLTDSLASGNYTFTASFAGDAYYAAGSSPSQDINVSTTASSTAVTSSINPLASGQTILFSAVVTNNTPTVATGSVTFMDGTNSLGSITLDSTGTATYSTSLTTLGTHSITAVYSGDSRFSGSTSAALQQSVIRPVPAMNYALSSIAVGPPSPNAPVTLDASGDVFGTAPQDGAYDDGTVYEIAHGGTVLITLASFSGGNGQYPQGGVTFDAGGDLFGATAAGGANGDGTVYEIAHGSTVITTLASFGGGNGANPYAGVTLDASGDLFGTTKAGGAGGDGTVFEIAQGGTGITTLASFNGTNGQNPSVKVTLDASGDILGTTSAGGTSGDGTVFEIQNGSTTLTTLVSFNGTNGKSPLAGVAIDSSGNVFGTAAQGGGGSFGTVYEIPNGSTTLTTLASFNYTNGEGPRSVALDAAGDLFGAAIAGGSGGDGTVFELAHTTKTTITALASFTGSNGENPQAGVTLDASGDVFGTTYQGGAGGGTVYEVAHGTKVISILASFDGSVGAYPATNVALDSSGNLYGATLSDGAGGYGTVYEVANGSTTVTTLASFTGNSGNGSEVGAVVLDAAGDLFGTCGEGGASSDGTVFEIPQGSSIITTLAVFNGSNGSAPVGSLIIDPSGNLFGTCIVGGGSNDGAVFEVAQGSDAVTMLASFNGTNGKMPRTGVTLDARGDLFGTTSAGGASGDGTVFEIAQGSNAITALASFNGSNGATPYGGVTLDASGDLFGTTSIGGAGNDGTVFEIPYGSQTIRTLASFNGSNGQAPDAGITFDAAGNIFGTTVGGGLYNYGTAFEIPYASTTITTLASFNGINGSSPGASIILDSSGDIFGTTETGGGAGFGTVFELTVTASPPAVMSMTPNTGSAAGGTSAVITGANFTGATAVTFGGVPATSFTVNSSTQITAVDPAGAPGAVDVQVMTPGGTSATSNSDQFTYVAPPTVVSVTTNDGEGDGNTTQASEVRQLVVTFSQAVNLTQPGAFSLGVYNLDGTGGAVSGNGANDGSITDISSALNTATTTDGGLTWTITFAAGTSNTDASASLIDGIYSFSINNSDVTSNGVALTGSNTYTFHRLYGDVTGVGAVNNADARDFSEAYGAAAGSANYNAALDFGGAGANINNTDARDFSLRYGQTFSSVLPPGGIN